MIFTGSSLVAGACGGLLDMQPIIIANIDIMKNDKDK